MPALQNKLREQLAQSFLDALNQEQLPWKACWQSSLPENAVSRVQYRGVNSLMLSCVAAQAGYADSRWCTFKQAAEKGWHIRKGSKGAPVEYWAYYDKETRKLLSWQEARKVMREQPDYAAEHLQLRSRVYTVFNAQQIEGIPEFTHSGGISPVTVLEQRDTLLSSMALHLQEGGSQPCYIPETDTVCLPYAKEFFDEYAYACTLLHECGHATGHKSRLNRDLTADFGTAGYAREELRAEIASAFTCQALGLRLSDAQLQPHMTLHKAYIQSWARTLKDAPEELFRAIRDAERISDYLIEKGGFLRERENAGKEVPEKMEYVGRIDFLGTSGAVRESVNYRTQDAFIRAVKNRAEIGVPMSVVFYEDSQGKTISGSFLQDLDTPLCGVSREKHPQHTAETAERASLEAQVAEAKQYAKSLPPAVESCRHKRER